MRLKLSPYRIAATGCSLLALSAALYAVAQPKKGTVRSAGGRRQGQAQNKPFHFGDITVSNYRTISGTIGVSVEANGPDTTVDITDPKVPQAKRQLKASKLSAFMAESKTGQSSEVERVEAIGSVRFSSTMPTKDSGTQTLHGTGTKGIYYKSKSLVELEGPVNFSGDLKDKGGKALQSADGTAAAAAYDEEKQELTLEGPVSVNVTSPSTKEPTKLENLSNLKIDLGAKPIKYIMSEGSVHIKPKETAPKEPAKKKP
jgi:lipopolysaccharide export system protein LptA